MTRILVVDDERSLRDLLSIMLKKEGYAVDVAESLEGGLEALRGKPYSLVITDLRLPDGSGTDILRRCHELTPSPIVMVITAYASTETAVDALRFGAYDYFTKPFDIDEVRNRISNALERYRLEDENAYFRQELKAARRMGEIIGASRPMVEIFSVGAPHREGELHGSDHRGEWNGERSWSRARSTIGPTEPIGPSLPSTAGRCRRGFWSRSSSVTSRGRSPVPWLRSGGLFEAAHHGTLLLDEIGQTSPSMQVKLLRVLQERRIRPVGGDRGVSR